MRIQAVVGGVRCSADKPFCERLVPLQRGVERCEPVQMLGRLLCPESLRIVYGTIVKSLISLHRANGCLLREGLAWWKDPGFDQDVGYLAGRRL